MLTKVLSASLTNESAARRSARARSVSRHDASGSSKSSRTSGWRAISASFISGASRDRSERSKLDSSVRTSASVNARNLTARVAE